MLQYYDMWNTLQLEEKIIMGLAVCICIFSFISLFENTYNIVV